MQVAEQTMTHTVLDELVHKFGIDSFVIQDTADQTPTLWVSVSRLREVLRYLKNEFAMLYDLFGIDERLRINRTNQPD